MASLSFGDAVMAGMQAAADKQMAAQQQAWIDALVEAKLGDEATLRSILSLEAVAPRKRGRPAAGGKGKGKAKACDVPDAERCLGCSWQHGNLDKARCASASERDDQLCSGCGADWDVVWADRKADGRVSYGTKSVNPSDVAWFGFWGVDRLPIWPGELHCVMAGPDAKSNSGNGVAMAKSLDAAAGGAAGARKKQHIWHQARQAWGAPAEAEAEPEQTEDTTVVAEQETRDFDGLPYVVSSVDGQMWAWPAGDWAPAAEADYDDADTAVAQVDETDGTLSFTDMDIAAVHEEKCTPA